MGCRFLNVKNYFEGVGKWGGDLGRYKGLIVDFVIFDLIKIYKT